MGCMRCQCDSTNAFFRGALALSALPGAPATPGGAPRPAGRPHGHFTSARLRVHVPQQVEEGGQQVPLAAGEQAAQRPALGRALGRQLQRADQLLVHAPAAPAPASAGACQCTLAPRVQGAAPLDAPRRQGSTPPPDNGADGLRKHLQHAF